jgi:hypothetical protein
MLLQRADVQRPGKRADHYTESDSDNILRRWILDTADDESLFRRRQFVVLGTMRECDTRGWCDQFQLIYVRPG